MGDPYVHGHHESVLRSHRWRTATNSAAYLLPYLASGQALLDVGCGPGTITRDFAALLHPGRVVGVDASAAVIEEARRSPAGDNLTFATGDVYRLEFDDDTFDVVHAHQVLQHLTDPIAALGEMRRVLRPGGRLAVRDSDYRGFIWSPGDPLLDRWNDLYHDINARNGAEADAGRYLLGWVRAAGFADVVASSSTWTFADDDARNWWGGLWADRMLMSAIAEQGVAYGLTDRAELEAIAGAWRRWTEQPDGMFIVVHGEIVARA